MATKEEIQDKVLLGRAYYLELLGAYYIEDSNGCKSCKPNDLARLRLISKELQYRINNDIVNEDVQKLYKCYLDILSDYSGMSISLDPNAQIPGITIIVEGGSGVTLPYWQDIPWSEMTNDVDGYRDTYFNLEWAGYNPMIQIQGVVMYQDGVDYDNDGQGTIVFRPGKGIYDGQYFRAGNFQPYVAPTPIYPLPNTYRFVNNSSIDTQYSITGLTPLVAGQTVSGNVTLGMSLLGLIEEGQQLRFRRYNADGTVNLELVSTNPPSFQTATTAVDLTKGYEFLYTDESAILPNPPTNGIVDDINDTFTFTLSTT